MYGYNYNPAFSTYPSTGGGHPGYDEREMWPARSPPNYALPAPYQYHDYERVPRGAAGVPPPPTSMSAATTTCAANCWWVFFCFSLFSNVFLLSAIAVVVLTSCDQPACCVYRSVPIFINGLYNLQPFPNKIPSTQESQGCLDTSIHIEKLAWSYSY